MYMYLLSSLIYVDAMMKTIMNFPVTSQFLLVFSKDSAFLINIMCHQIKINHGSFSMKSGDVAKLLIDV